MKYKNSFAGCLQNSVFYLKFGQAVAKGRLDLTEVLVSVSSESVPVVTWAPSIHSSIHPSICVNHICLMTKKNTIVDLTCECEAAHWCNERRQKENVQFVIGCCPTLHSILSRTVTLHLTYMLNSMLLHCCFAFPQILVHSHELV